MIDPTQPLAPIVFGTPEWIDLQYRVAKEPAPVRGVCAQCEGVFIATAIGQIYCTRQCRRRAQYERDRVAHNKVAMYRTAIQRLKAGRRAA